MDLYKWASVTDQWDLVDKVLQIADRSYIWGPPGLGKSFSAITRASQGRKVENQTLNEDLSVQELMGFWAPLKTGGAEWHDGPIIAAMRSGSCLILNELHRASSSVLDFLLAVLDSDGSRYVTIPSGETVEADPRFKVIATANEGPSVLSDALANRFEVAIHVTAPNPQMIDSLNKAYSGLGTVVSNSFSSSGTTGLIHPRKAFAWAKMLRGGLTKEQAALAVFGNDAENMPQDFLTALGMIAR